MILVLAALKPFSYNLLQDVQQMLSQDFMRDAFLAGTAVALVAGAVGYFVVLRGQAFTGDALAHVAFAGTLAAAVIGLNLRLGLFGITAAVALVMALLGERVWSRDVAVGTTLAWVLGLGVLFLSIYTSTKSAGNGVIGVNVLFGSVFGVGAQAARVSAFVAAVTVLLLLAIARPLLFASLDPEVAAARGLPVRVLDVVFLALVAITVAESVQIVGALLIFALLVTPAAVAARLMMRPFYALTLSAGLAIAFTWIGLAIAFYTPYPVSFLISSLAFASYLGAIAWQRLYPVFTHSSQLVTRSL